MEPNELILRLYYDPNWLDVIHFSINIGTSILIRLE
jgi:hypothetical protein